MNHAVGARCATPRYLHALAAQLGSDVPFALHGGAPRSARAVGEQLATVLARSTFHWALAFADDGLSTPRGVRARSTGCGKPRVHEPGQPPLARRPRAAVLAARWRRVDPAELAPLLGNELQPGGAEL